MHVQISASGFKTQGANSFRGQQDDRTPRKHVSLAQPSRRHEPQGDVARTDEPVRGRACQPCEQRGRGPGARNARGAAEQGCTQLAGREGSDRARGAASGQQALCCRAKAVIRRGAVAEDGGRTGIQAAVEGSKPREGNWGPFSQEPSQPSQPSWRCAQDLVGGQDSGLESCDGGPGPSEHPERGLPVPLRLHRDGDAGEGVTITKQASSTRGPVLQIFVPRPTLTSSRGACRKRHPCRALFATQNGWAHSPFKGSRA